MARNEAPWTGFGGADLRGSRKPPFSCSVGVCDEPAICGLRNKETGTQINVCRQHFESFMGRPYEGEPRTQGRLT